MNDHCQNCGRQLVTVNTQVRGDSRVRYLGCRVCKLRPEDNKRIIPLQYAPRRATSSTH